MNSVNDNCGVYIIEHRDTGNIYVGASSNLKKRQYQHLRELYKGTHHNEGLQEAYNQSATGNSCLEFRTIELCDIGMLGERETAHMTTLNPVFNQYDGGGGYFVVSDSWRDKQRKKLIGKQLRTVGTYLTPWGSFTSGNSAAKAIGDLISQPGLWNVCNNPEKVITRQAYCKSRYLMTTFDESVVGKRWSELGFGFIEKANEQH
ncbi:hypothetical protein CDO26_27785 (plasmid) [Sinorhizobium meliloti]|uniref:GIY-YIG nuclease family protein n=1 Tax=Rhizobium meliloti TaxID=382 RepID=UPI000B4A1159|nr:GIY-YIG nuclease family protein [Sinorhizobium meliloti]ASP88157.1 hypothetical protein CDO26_27785 [Sinorhizobium meliloti]MQW25148.1 hypothetical protein [Sinorhizobium meliloti]